MNAADDNDRKVRVADEAMAWAVRVQSPEATGDDWSALTDWLEASEDHLAAYDRAEALVARIEAEAPALNQALTRPGAKVLEFRPREKAQPAPRPANDRGMWSAIAAVAACLVVVPAAWNASQGPETIYRTGVGETRNLVLSDGSRIQMDAGSELKVRMGWFRRRVSMGQAQASFDVAKDARKPFLISVGDQQVRVVGTAFNIRHFRDETTVTVRRGIVEVSQPRAPAAPVARLLVGDQLSHLEGQTGGRAAKVDTTAAYAWTQGQMICAERPLADIVADINRRYPVPITVSESAGRLKFSGVLELGDQDAVVERLARYLSLPHSRTDRAITLG